MDHVAPYLRQRRPMRRLVTPPFVFGEPQVLEKAYAIMVGTAWWCRPNPERPSKWSRTELLLEVLVRLLAGPARFNRGNETLA